LDHHVKLIAVLIAAAFAHASATPSPPTATTGGAEQVTTSSAVVTGSVNPGGLATTYHFEYGTTTDYGLKTVDQDAGSGTAPVDVKAALAGLTSDTTYHYRLVAQNAAGVARGADRSFRTAAPPRPPGVSTGAAQDVGPTGATVTGTVDPNRLPTNAHFVYGTTTSYGQSTPDQSVGSGDSAVRVSATLAGLEPSTRYHYRLVAANAAGTVRGRDRSFVTARGPTGVTIALSDPRPVWGTGIVVTGIVTGRGIGGIPVALERQDFPFTTAFAQVGPTVRASSAGAYTIAVPPLFSTARVRVLTRSQVVVSSPVVQVSVAVKVGIRTRRLRGSRRAIVTGTTAPAVPSGRASLQRLTASGRWVTIKRAGLATLPDNRSRYRFNLRLRRTPLRVRVVVSPRDGGAHVRGTSRTRLLPRRAPVR
jgi:hypothetical protein